MTLQIIVNKQKCFFWLCASSSAPELRLQLPDGALIWRSHTGQPQQSQVTRAKLITPPKLQKMHPRRERDPDGWLSGLCFCRTGYMEPRFSIQTSNYKVRGGEVKFLLLCDDFFFHLMHHLNLNLLEKSFNAVMIKLLKIWHPCVRLSNTRLLWACWQCMRLFSTAGPKISSTCFLYSMCCTKTLQ